MNITTRESLRDDLNTRLSAGIPLRVKAEDRAHVSSTFFGSAAKAMQNGSVNNLRHVTDISRQSAITLSGKYESGFDVPIIGGKKTVGELIRAGKFASNSVPENWQYFWEAQRIDLTIRKAQHQTIRQLFYDVLSTPNANPIMELQEMFPYAFKFKLNNGEGQSVPMGVKNLGQKDVMRFYMKAAGFAFTRLADLFDRTLDMSMVNNGIAMAEALQKDHDAMSPILDFDYSTTTNGNAQTAAIATGGNSQEDMYLTITKSIDDFMQRTDPFLLDKTLSSDGLIMLGTEYDLSHIRKIMDGLPSIAEKKYGAIGEIKQMVAYDTEYIQFPDHTDEYTGVTKGKVFLVKPNRYMKLAIKRGLTMETDANPDVKTLAMMEKAWFYCESQYNEIGISNFIQEVTLPVWSFA